MENRPLQTDPQEQEYDVVVGFKVRTISEEAAIREVENFLRALGLEAPPVITVEDDAHAPDELGPDGNAPVPGA